MNDADVEDSSTARSVATNELEKFRSIQQLHNHWARKNGGPAYYWYLTFEDCTNLHSLATRCQHDMPFDYYDFTPINDLHMTLDRIAPKDEFSPKQLHAVASAATEACSNTPPFDISMGGIGGTPGALGLSAFPREPLRHLRATLREATFSVYPNAPVKAPTFNPHLAIAYCNSDLPATQAIAAVECLSGLEAVTVSVRHVALVLLERKHRAYSWQTVTRVPLTGTR